MLTPQSWAALIPHAGAMSLIDAVVAWDTLVIHAIAERHTVHGHPLAGCAGLHAVHLAEYGAQATAVHGALLDRQRGQAGLRPGRLVSLRDVELAVEYVELGIGRLDIRAECIATDVHGAHYAFAVEQDGHPLATGRVVVMYGPI